MRMFIILAVVTAFKCTGATAETCSRYCPKGKPCGDACIPAQSLCRKSWTTACSGERPATESKHYDNPKHVDQRPTNKSDAK